MRKLDNLLVFDSEFCVEGDWDRRSSEFILEGWDVELVCTSEFGTEDGDKGTLEDGRP